MVPNRSIAALPIICNRHNKPIRKFQMPDAPCTFAEIIYCDPSRQAADFDNGSLVPSDLALEVVGEYSTRVACKKGNGPMGVPVRRFLDWSSGFEGVQALGRDG